MKRQEDELIKDWWYTVNTKGPYSKQYWFKASMSGSGKSNQFFCEDYVQHSGDGDLTQKNYSFKGMSYFECVGKEIAWCEAVMKKANYFPISEFEFKDKLNSLLIF